MTERDDIQRDLQVLLTADPSPAFAGRVREAIAPEASRSWRPRLSGRWVVPSAACVLVVLVWVLAPRPASVRQQLASSVPAVSVGPPAAPRVAPAVRAVVGRHPLASGRERVRPVSGAEGSSNEVLVPDDERLALVHLLQGLKEDRASVPPTLGPKFDADGLLLPPEPVVVVPLPELVPPDSDGANGKIKGGAPGGDHR